MRYKDFSVTGDANDTVFDGGLTSTVVEPKKIRAILISVELYAGNHVEGWIGSQKIIDILDYVFNTHDVAAGDTPYPSTTKITRLPIEEDIEPGQTFVIGIRCGATDTDIFGAYEYEVKT